jgi:hypothetical protein
VRAAPGARRRRSGLMPGSPLAASRLGGTPTSRRCAARIVAGRD